eukprot:gnl/TRDRNA2_/TRDRNA2_175280_c0_seq16.p1 gnl/TRDRNA2_/TRDRNA2_175280_c0~~gnl/TRDRNA2_/TRDRNA2_175280_c0_seq16.p1  ORF type:complete len:331 (+),score=58.91 gnl/TRDRNA2_/TRDRNA2_175280_c0_seq16:54-1046(+)
MPALSDDFLSLIVQPGPLVGIVSAVLGLTCLCVETLSRAQLESGEMIDADLEANLLDSDGQDAARRCVSPELAKLQPSGADCAAGTATEQSSLEPGDRSTSSTTDHSLGNGEQASSSAKHAAYLQLVDAGRVRGAQAEAEVVNQRKAHQTGVWCTQLASHWLFNLQASRARAAEAEAEMSKERQAYEALSTKLVSVRQALEAASARIEHMAAGASRERHSHEAKWLLAELAAHRRALDASEAQAEEAEAETSTVRQTHEALSMELMSAQQALEASTTWIEQVEAEASRERQSHEAIWQSLQHSMLRKLRCFGSSEALSMPVTEVDQAVGA